MNNTLDIEQPEALVNYLRERGAIGQDETPQVTVLGGGVSNRTVLVERAGGESWVLKQALGKLRVKVDWFSSPKRIANEALGIEWLSQLAPPQTITPLIFFDAEAYVLAMRAVPQPHVNWRTMLLRGELEREHVAQFARILGTIQRNATLRAVEIEPLFRDRSFFESLRIEPYYAYTATQVPESAAFYEALIASNRENLLTLVHGDYSPKNVLVYQDRLILLDHEVIHWGDPAFDVGFALTHLLSKAHHVVEKRAEFAEAANYFWREYLGTLGDVAWAEELEPRAAQNTLGCLLARVAGRSPHDYWTAEERERQREIVPKLMGENLMRVKDVIESFVSALDS